MANLSSEILKGMTTEDLEKYRASLQDQLSTLAIFMSQVDEVLRSRQLATELEQAS